MSLQNGKKIFFGTLYQYNRKYIGGFMSTGKCIAITSAAGAAISGGVNLYYGMKARKISLANAEKVASENGGKIPVNGMTKDGKLWNFDMTVDDVKKNADKSLAMGTTMNAIAGAAVTAIVSGLTLLLKSKIR